MEMEIDFTSEEKRLVEYAKEAIVKYNKLCHAKGDIDTFIRTQRRIVG